jgi:hypothetical protein
MDVAMLDYFGRFIKPDGSVHWPREALMVTGIK